MTDSSASQSVSLTPSQYQTLNSLYQGSFGIGSSLPGTLSNGSYSVPASNYSDVYGKVSGVLPNVYDGTGQSWANNGFFSSLPNPQSITQATPTTGATPSAPARTGTSPPPTYAQFLANQPNGGAAPTPSSTIYNGGPAPGGMNSSDASLLQSLYAPIATPAKANGGFVPDVGLGAPPQHFADGGMPSSAEMASWVTRREATDATSTPHGGGLFASAVPGRTDKLDSIVPAGAYVLPADVVSGLGEGNTMAGSAVLDKMFHTNPFAIQGSPLHRGMGIPSAPRAFVEPPAPRADGGAGPTRIIAAGGEYLVRPEAVKRLGGGNMKNGHKILDHFVVHARNKTADEMKKLPGPKK